MPGYGHQLSAQWVRATDDKQVEECSDIGMSHCATIKIPARALAQQTRRRPATRQLRLSTIKSDYTCGIVQCGPSKNKKKGIDQSTNGGLIWPIPKVFKNGYRLWPPKS